VGCRTCRFRWVTLATSRFDLHPEQLERLLALEEKFAKEGEFIRRIFGSKKREAPARAAATVIGDE
jgi:hypothetical protein